MLFPSQRKDRERVHPEPITLLDKDVTGHPILGGRQSLMPGRWAGRRDEDSERQDYIVPSDYALGEISRLHYCICRERAGILIDGQEASV